MATAKFPAEAGAATRLGRRWFRAAGELEREVENAKRDLGNQAEPIFAQHALRLTGRLARGIHAVQEGDTIAVTAEARDPETGFDYLRVTRFGHRKARIRPTRRKSPASVISTRGGRATGRAAALRLMIGGRVVYRRTVPGFRPKSDWAERAMPQIRQRAAHVATRLGRRVEGTL